MPLSAPPAPNTPFLPEDTFKDDVVFITGAGTGLGKAFAQGFAKLGASIVVASRKPEHRESGVAAVKALGARAADVALNLRDPDSIHAAFDTAEKQLGPVTILINNAAANFPTPAESLSPNGWHAITQTVLDGTFFCSTELARRRIAANGRGAILNVGATYGWTGGPGASPSAAAKAGVMNLTQSLAVEWAPDDIRVNGIIPGTFPHADLPAAMQVVPGSDDRAMRCPAMRVGELHELAWAACFLCSPYAAYITGHNLVVDGGNWLRRELQMPLFRPVRSWADTRAARAKEKA